MSIFLFADNARSTLGAAIAPTDTTITLAAGGGNAFPQPGAGQQFAVTLNDLATESIYEVCYCTNRSGDVLTVIRGQEATGNYSWAVGDFVWNGPTAGQQASFVQLPEMLNYSIAPNFGATASNSTITATGNISSTTGNVAANQNVTAGQSISAGTNIAAGGSIATTGSGTISTSAGNIIANAGRLRATYGALHSGDQYAASILADFANEISGAYIYTQLPNGIIIQANEGASTTGNGDLITFPSAFPTNCLQVVLTEGNPIGWLVGNPLSVTIFGAQAPGPNGFSLYTASWSQMTGQWVLKGGVAYRYIAIGY